MTTKTCRYCLNWQPNGGVLGSGYCIRKDWAYRKPDQSCKDFELAHFYIVSFTDWNEGAELFGNERWICVKARSLADAQDWFRETFPKIGSFTAKEAPEL